MDQEANQDLIKLGYREIADRLGISPDAARMKAKRAAKAGRWRIIPGNHPNDRVLVELPARDMNENERVGGERLERSEGGRSFRTREGEQGNALTAQFLVSLAEAQNRIRDLTDQLTAEKDQHRQTAIELAQAETREAGLAGEIDRLQGNITRLRTALARKQHTLWQRLRGK